MFSWCCLGYVLIRVILNTCTLRKINGMSGLSPPIDAVKLRRMIRRVLEPREEIAVAYLYGSMVKGYAGEDSDVDVGLLLRDGFSGDALYPARVAGEIERGLGLQRDVDVRILNDQSVRFQYRVVKEGEVILCRDEGVRVGFETRTVDMYLDIKPFHDRYEEERRLRLLS